LNSPAQARDLAWFADRLMAMSAGEMLYRLEEQRRKAIWRSRPRTWDHFAGAPGSPPCIPGLRDHVLERVSGKTVSAYARRLEKVRSGRIELLGVNWPRIDLTGIGEGSPWLLDPISGRYWPGVERYCFDTHTKVSRGLGDVKFAAELNRLQMLPGAALVAACRNDRSLARWIFDVIHSWMVANPPFGGINWASGVELGLRLISISLTTSLLGPELIPVESRSEIGSFVSAHLFWLNRFPSLFSSANNHLLAESVGIFIGASASPDAARAKQLTARARRRIERETQLQILSDGCGAEQATGYTLYVLEALLLAGYVARACNAPLPKNWEDRLRLAAEAAAWFVGPNGDIPAIGDDDETRVIPDPAIDARYPGSVVASAAGFLGQVQPAATETWETLRTVIFNPPRAGTPRRGFRIFPVGGYSLVRQHLSGRTIHLMFDHGPLGYLSLAAHGHADTLSVWLNVDGAPVFIDPGTFLYRGAGIWRDRLRVSMAHNTLSLVGHSTSVPSREFTWRHKARGVLVEFDEAPDWSLTGRHDGYAKSFGLTHQRRITAVPDGFSICDTLLGANLLKRPYEVRYLLHPSCHASSEEDSIVIVQGASVILRLHSPRHSEMKIEERLFASRFGKMAPTQGIVLRPLDDTVTIELCVQIVT
jgi:uncharacterized heparinase superfamily protein